MSSTSDSFIVRLAASEQGESKVLVSHLPLELAAPQEEL